MTYGGCDSWWTVRVLPSMIAVTYSLHPAFMPSTGIRGSTMRGLLAYLILIYGSASLAGAFQCYSCKASGPNEIEANLRCLEKAFLENCDDFYNYYDEVENQDVLSYEYYEYAEEANGGIDEEKEETGLTTKGGIGKVGEEDDQLEDEVEYYYEYETDETENSTPLDGAHQQSLGKRRKRSSKVAKNVNEEEGDDINNESDKENNGGNTTEENYEYDYEDYEEDPTEPPTTTTTAKPEEKKTTKLKSTKPRAPEHFCYSSTKKNAWESYSVEKGCKKITYCKEHMNLLPEWSKPWNFCCDRSRCNAKLVKDKPQRIFGMGCRRTDDCIQGYNTRHVCPNFFKTCPKVSSAVIKMECRVKTTSLASLKNSARYQQQFRERKCYCASGYSPKGPICTSASTFILRSTHLLVAMATLQSTIFILLQ